MVWYTQYKHDLSVSVCLSRCACLWSQGRFMSEVVMSVKTSQNTWVVETIVNLVLNAPENHLADFGGQPILDAPVVGVAAGDDPLFMEFREAVSDRHIMPCDLLDSGTAPSQVRVISWANPFTSVIRQSNVGEWPSELYSVARNNGAALIERVQSRLKAAIENEGYAAVIPSATDQYDTFRVPDNTFSSTWSERHVAFAAGLGRFGLNAALITPVGINVRFGSIVTNLPLEPSSRIDDDYRAPCLRDGGKECMHCGSKCPVGAISSDGLDKTKCYEMRQLIRDRALEPYPQQFSMLEIDVVKNGRRSKGHSLGCALCQCGVPCEGRVPQFQEDGVVDA